jgi:hypothetical protein
VARLSARFETGVQRHASVDIDRSWRARDLRAPSPGERDRSLEGFPVASRVGYRSPSQLAWSPSQSALWSTFCSRKLEAINANIVYLDVFVLIAQTFLKNPALLALAPKQSEMPFVVVQAAALVTFVVLGALSLSRFRDMPS